MTHESVLLTESLEGLNLQTDGIYVDGTFGRGGHAAAIMQQLGAHGRLIAIDKDAAAIASARQQFGGDPRFQIFQGSFSRLSEFVREAQVFGKVNGILLDLGVSSPQLDEPARGFSFMQAGPLDMRMDQSQALDAASFVNQASADEMAEIFRNFGEERYAGRIARAIVEARQSAEIHSTNELAEIVKKANPRWERHKHPATRVFQALRIHINNELKDLSVVLEAAMEVLAPGGRLAVISFHSLEDRIVKQFMRQKEQGILVPANIPLQAVAMMGCFKRIGKAIKPQEDEVKNNVRARSAVLRIGEKIS